MTHAQRALYFQRLWPDACAAQGWDVRDDDRRRAVTQEATGQASASGLSQSQITALFDHLKWLADPFNLDKAMPVANPEQGEDAHRRRQLVWRVTQAAAHAGLAAEWIDQTAAEKVRAHRVGSWQALPLPELLKLSFTVAARTTEHARDRRASRSKRPAKAEQPPCIDATELPF